MIQPSDRGSSRNLTAEERREKQEQRRFDADQAMKEYEAEQRAFHANYERLRAERLAREELESSRQASAPSHAPGKSGKRSK